MNSKSTFPWDLKKNVLISQVYISIYNQFIDVILSPKMSISLLHSMLNWRYEYGSLYFWWIDKSWSRVLTDRDRLTRIKNGMIDRPSGVSLIAVGDDNTGVTRMRVGGDPVAQRVDVLESYRDKKGHPKDTPGSGRKDNDRHRLSRYAFSPFLVTYRWRRSILKYCHWMLILPQLCYNNLCCCNKTF